MIKTTFNPNKIQPRNRRRLLICFVVLAYGVFLGEIYSVVNFGMWVITHIITVILLGVGLIWPAIREKRWPSTPVDTPLLAMAVTMIISALISVWPRLALEGLFVWVSHVLAFCLLARLIQRGWADSLLRALMLVVGVVVLVGWFELAAWYFGLPFVPQFSQGWWELGSIWNPIPPVWHRLSFTLSNAVIVSAFLVITMPVVIAFAVTTRRPLDKLLVLVFILLMVVVLGATKSRGGWLGLSGGLVALMLLWVHRNFSAWSGQKQKLILGGAIGGSLLLIAVVVGVVWFMSQARANSNSQRVAYWGAALQIFSDQPVWGQGPGLFRWGWRLTPYAADIDQRVVTPHSIYLSHLTELGVVGAATGLWLLIAAGFAGRRVLGQSTDRRVWWRRAGCAAGLVGFLVQGVVETFPIWPIALPTLVLAAYLIVPYSVLKSENKFGTAVQLNQKIGQWSGPVIATVWVVCTVLVTYFAYPRWLAEGARHLAAQNNYRAAAAQIEQSVSLDPDFTLYQFEQATWLAQPTVAEYETARTIYRAALVDEPAQALNYANLAIIEWELGHTEAALQLMQQAVAIPPANGQFWLTLGTFAEQTGNVELALSAYAQTLAQNPDWMSSDFWDATAWRQEQVSAIIEQASETWSPEQRQQILLKYHLLNNDLDSAETLLVAEAPSFVRDLAAAQISLARQNPEIALQQVESALTQSPNNVEVRILQAQILVELGQLDEAAAVLKWVNFMGQGKVASANFAAGRLAQAQGQLDAAKNAYQQATRLPAYSLDYSVAVYRQLGALLPLPQLERTSSGPTSVIGWLALAELYQEAGRLEDAMQVYQAMLKIDPYLNVAQEALSALCRKNSVGCEALE